MDSEKERLKYCCSIPIDIEGDWIEKLRDEGLTDSEIYLRGVVTAFQMSQKIQSDMERCGIKQMKDQEIERKTFDMNQCKHGDQLIMRNGAKAFYMGRIDNYDFGEYFHHVSYRDDCGHDFIGTRTDEGWCFGSGLANNNDIVGFWGGVKNETKIV